MEKQVPTVSELLKDAPKNWGRWGAEDEVGALNFLTNAEVLRGVSAVKQGKTFTLHQQNGVQLDIGSGGAAVVSLARAISAHALTMSQNAVPSESAWL